ncbi:MAG: UDP-glucuronosyltransferase [Candidatus Nitrosocosmicus sp.]|nr:UDP-glucuronosyltransferase [Candidatus Nitrosocosmicus sp.]
MVLFFVSPIGLGHASRSIAIMNKLSLDRKNSFVSGSSACEFIKDSGYNVLNRYNPPKFDVKDGTLQHSFIWLLRYLFYYKNCKKIASEIIGKSNDENLIVSDEDFASLVVAEKLKKKRILITDITNTSFTSGFLAGIVERKMNEQMNKIIKSCDCVIIPDRGQDEDNIRYVGPIVRETTKGRDELRREFGFDKKTIVVSVGGTESGKYLLDKMIITWRKIKKSFDIDLVVISGPSLQIPLSTDCKNLGYVNNLHEYIFAADLVVSLAGRSTMDEALVYGTPGIFIPIKDHFEQELGAKRQGYEYKDIFRLEEIILKIIKSDFKRNNTGYNKDAFNQGAIKAAKIISEFL